MEDRKRTVRVQEDRDGLMWEESCRQVSSGPTFRKKGADTKEELIEINFDRGGGPVFEGLLSLAQKVIRQVKVGGEGG